jgi:hypothetical protein
MSGAALAGKVAVVTGASSGIGRATALALGTRGAHVVGVARRVDRLRDVRDAIARAGGTAEACRLDVTDRTGCEEFATDVLARHGGVDVLVNDAGLARGLAPVADHDEADWREMIETNVIALARMTKLFLPSLCERGGDVVHVGSVAGLQPYANGAMYCATKAAVEAFVQGLRLEIVDRGVRQLVIEPGLVTDTEFSEVRFHGDRDRAERVYHGLLPLTAADVAECIVFALTRPRHVSIQTMLVMPTAQATATVVHRRSE